MKKFLLTITALMTVAFAAQAQNVETESYETVSDEEYFEEEEDFQDDDNFYFLQGLGVYGGHYYLKGYSGKAGTTRETNYNDKFHIGIRYTIFEIEQFNLLIKYEQTSFWETYQHSYPFSENIYSPGLEINIRPNPSMKFTAALEHKSNGLDNEYSRSLNYARFAFYRYFYLRGDSYVSAALQTYLGFAYVESDASIANLYRYNGYFTAGAWYQTPLANFKCRVMATPYDHFKHCAVQVDMYYHPDYSLLNDVYFMVQYGYGLEQQHQFLPVGKDLIPQHYIRFGLAICPEFTL